MHTQKGFPGLEIKLCHVGGFAYTRPCILSPALQHSPALHSVVYLESFSLGLASWSVLLYLIVGNPLGHFFSWFWSDYLDIHITFYSSLLKNLQQLPTVFKIQLRAFCWEHVRMLWSLSFQPQLFPPVISTGASWSVGNPGKLLPAYPSRLSSLTGGASLCSLLPWQRRQAWLACLTLSHSQVVVLLVDLFWSNKPAL